jgi:hypothetical protein
MAAAVDVRLPTGDEDNLLGLGTTQAKVYFILSSSGERFSPHVNVGFTISGKGNVEPGLVYTPLGVSDEFNYAAGVEFIAHKRVTIVGDILGQTLFDAGTVAPESKTYQFRPGAGSSSAVPLETSTVNPLTGNAYRQLALTSGNLNLPLATAGAKVNVARNLLFTGNVLFPLTNGGLRDRLTFAFGLDFAF